MTIRTIILAVAFLIPMSASAQESADCVGVYDDNGTRVARAVVGSIEAGGNIFEVKMFLAESGLVALLGAKKDNLEGRAFLYFSGENCTGDAFIERNTVQPEAHLVGTDVWYPDTTATPAPLGPGSKRFAESGVCTNSTGSLAAAVPAFNFTLPTFTPPFHLEPEPCFTPDDPDPERFINGCIKNNGTLKIVDDPADCSSRETPISWLGE